MTNIKECFTCIENEKQRLEKLTAHYKYVSDWRKVKKLCSCGQMVRQGNFRHKLTQKHLNQLSDTIFSLSPGNVGY